MDQMGWLAWLVIGAVAGWLASIVMKTNRRQGIPFGRTIQTDQQNMPALLDGNFRFLCFHKIFQPLFMRFNHQGTPSLH
jgi:hypothetical protein